MVLDGQPSLLVAIERSTEPLRAVSSDSDLPSNESGVDHVSKDCEEMEGLLSTVTLESVLRPFISLPTLRDDVSSLSRDVLALPLSSLFSYRDHITPFTTPVSFYWTSIYHLSSLPSDQSLKSFNAISTTVCTLSHASLGNPYLVYTVLSRVFSIGLDLAGVRLLFGEKNDSLLFGKATDPQGTDNGRWLNLALALRGPNAVYGWTDALGPDDSALAKVTDPSSVSAVFGSGLVYAVRNPYQCANALAKWFGGRACLKSGAVLGMSDARTKIERRKRQRVRFSESESEDSTIANSSPLLQDVILPPIISNLPLMVAQAYSKSLLVVSPNVPPSCYSSVLVSCNELGFDIFGCKRIRLNGKRANALEIPLEFASHFTPSSTPPSPLILHPSPQSPLFTGVVTSVQPPPPLPSVIVIIGRENSVLHFTALKKLILQKLQLLVRKNEHVNLEKHFMSDSPDTVVHLIPYSEGKLKFLGSFAVPVPPGNRMELEDNEDGALREEICFVAVPGVRSIPVCVSLLDRIFHIAQTPPRTGNALDATGGGYGGFELVGMRIVPQLSRFHAKRLCPILVGDPLYSQAVQLLTDKPATLLVFRGVCCNTRVLECIGSSRVAGHAVEKRLQFVISRDLSEAVRFTSLFFSGKDLFSDSSSQMLTPYLPTSWIHQSDILQGFFHPKGKLFSTFWFPIVQLKLAVKILNKLSRSGFAIAGISTVEVNMDGGDKQVSSLCL
jgi:hypothetical protein